MPKRSTISSRRNSPDWRPPLFIDQTNGSTQLSEILTAAEWSVTLHRDHYPNRGNIADHEWVPEAATMGCAIISCDKHMRGWLTEDGLVRPKIESSHAKIFFIKSGLSIPDTAYVIGMAQRHICRVFRNNASTFVFARLHARGNRLGEVQVLSCGQGSKTQKKYGMESA